MSANGVPTIELNDGNGIPQLGLGVFKVDAGDTARVVAEALELGYRHIDTAQMYGNEAGVGEAMRGSGLPRDEIFVTSKLNNGNHRPDDARRSFEETLAALGLDHVDLFLIHWPRATQAGDAYVDVWRTLEELQAEGGARSIGVSNFLVAHLKKLAEETETVPAVNQIELHPFFQNAEVKAYGEARGIATEAWAPIARGGSLLEEPAIVKIAASHERTPAQIVLRWHVERGNIVFPKSARSERLRENLSLFDFALEADELARIDELDEGEPGRTGPHPDAFG